MLIQVHYPDNSFDYVDDRMLCTLIESKEIYRFKRSSGWVTVGIDPLRKCPRKNHSPTYLDLEITGNVHNLIRVEFSDFSFDYVTGDDLDNLLESKKVFKFQRASGWVSVGCEPVRRSKRDEFIAPL